MRRFRREAGARRSQRGSRLTSELCGAVHVRSDRVRPPRLWCDLGQSIRLSLGVLLGLLLVVGVAGAVPRRIYVANVSCTGHAYRPRQITIACRDGKFYAAHLRYRTYGGATASAAGELVENNCLPNCTDGMAIKSPGTIRLSHAQSCHGRLYYERIAWKIIESKGHPEPHGSGTIKPQLCGGS
jgi:hypothetical protein